MAKVGREKKAPGAGGVGGALDQVEDIAPEPVGQGRLRLLAAAVDPTQTHTDCQTLRKSMEFGFLAESGY
eukprot:COSAG05_NODE_16154_length_352_cov_1.055336_1_plen_69_part_01